MSVLHRRPWWRQTVSEFHRSGQSANAFAAHVGVAPSLLRWWVRELRDDPMPAANLVPVEVMEAPVELTPPAALHVTVGPAALRFDTDVAPSYLGELVAAIARATRC